MIEETKISIVDKIVFGCFLYVFLTTATIYANPFTAILRWLMCGVLLWINIVYAFRNNDGKICLFPKEIVFLFFPMIIQAFQTTFVIVSLVRSLSFFLYFMSLYSFMNKKYVTKEYIKYFFTFFAWVTAISLTVANLLNFNRTSLNGDFIGIYSNRNFATCMFAAILISALYLRSENKGHIIKAFLGGVIITSLIFILRTNSRIGVIGIVVIIVFDFIYNFISGNLNDKIKLGILGVAILIISVYISQKYNIIGLQRILSETGDSSSGLSRGEVWEIAKLLISEKPILGWGSNAVYYHTFVDQTSGDWGVHNSFLVMLIEGGIVGAFFYFYFFVKTCGQEILYFICNIKVIKNTEGFHLKMYTIIFIIYGLVNAVSESYLFAIGNPMALPFWLSFITLISYAKAEIGEVYYEGSNNG